MYLLVLVYIIYFNMSIKILLKFDKMFYNIVTMNTNESISREYSYKDFAEALFDLKDNARLSYGQIADKCGLSDAYLVNIVNRKNLAPNSKNIKKIAKALKVEPEYFYEYRLRRLNNLLNNNREHVDLFLRDLEISQKKRKARKARVSSRKATERIAKAREASI